MSKVFRDFKKKYCMKFSMMASITGGIAIVVIILLVILISNQESDVMEVEDVLDKELRPNEEISPEIQKKLDEVEKINLENQYSQKEREWITSGQFKIERSEYVLGENIFVRIGGLSFDEKGQIVFLRPLNNTHYSVYWTIPFDGSDKSAFNYYLQPQLSKNNGYCTVDDFVGEWRVTFRGTEYKNLEFKITEEILPGDEESYQPVC